MGDYNDAVIDAAIANNNAMMDYYYLLRPTESTAQFVF